MLHLIVNGRPIECPAGATLLQAIRRAGADVPTLCHDPRLKPIGACRLCLVHAKGRAVPIAACTSQAEEGMEIQTDAPHLERLRRTLLQLLARDYPAEALRESPELPFHRHLHHYGLEEELRDRGDPRPPVDRSHPYTQVDMSRCVQCFRCVRICEEVQGQFVWQLWNRGAATRICPDSRSSLVESSCVSCGACVDSCPTGALADCSLLPRGARLDWTRTVCPYCGTGCEMNVASDGERLVAVRPVEDAPVNKGHLCVKGRYAFEFNHAVDRVTEPMLRDGTGWKTVPWERAIESVAQGLRRAIDAWGPDAIGMLGSARATNETNYLTQKFARVVLGTNNVDCCARVCHAPSARGMKQLLGTGAATNSFDDIERAACIVVCGANPTENHPVIGARIKQAALRGAALLVIDPRRIELANYSRVHLALRPGTNVPLLNAMACAILDEGLCDDEFARDRVSGGDEFRRHVTQWPPERVAGICGVDAKLIREAARIYATHRPAMCFHGLGVTEHSQGTDAVMCLVNLALLTGNIGKPGGGVNPLRGQNNVQGAAHMGCDPDSLTGFAPLATSTGLFEAAWRARLPASRGLNLMEMIDAAQEGRLKALWAIGYDVALTNPNASATCSALSRLDLLIVQDLFQNRVADYASVFLPAASPFEQDGTYMNAERRVQRIRQAIAPRGHSMPDWRIICEVARAMGHGGQFDFDSPEEIWDEIRSVWPAGRGITYSRLNRGGLQWPCPHEKHPGTPILHVDAFPIGGRAALRMVDFTPTGEQTSPEYPFLLITGRTLYQFNAGTMTMRTPNARLRREDTLDVSPADAARIGLCDGARATVHSRYGKANLRVHVSESVKPGELFATFHTAEAGVNNVTGNRRDHQVGTPEYKVTAVRVEPERPT